MGVQVNTPVLVDAGTGGGTGIEAEGQACWPGRSGSVAVAVKVSSGFLVDRLDCRSGPSTGAH